MASWLVSASAISSQASSASRTSPSWSRSSRPARSPPTDPLKLVLVIAATNDADRLVGRLVACGLPATKIASSGGFLRRGSTTILSGVDDKDVDMVLDLTRQECRSRKEVVPIQSLPVLTEAGPMEPVEVRVGGATVFVLDVDRHERF